MKTEGALKFVFEKETKNYYRFKEVADGQPFVIGTLYVQKWAFNDKPVELEVSIREPERPKEGGAK